MVATDRRRELDHPASHALARMGKRCKPEPDDSEGMGLEDVPQRRVAGVGGASVPGLHRQAEQAYG